MFSEWPANARRPNPPYKNAGIPEIVKLHCATSISFEIGQAGHKTIARAVSIFFIRGPAVHDSCPKPGSQYFATIHAPYMGTGPCMAKSRSFGSHRHRPIVTHEEIWSKQFFNGAASGQSCWAVRSPSESTFYDAAVPPTGEYRYLFIFFN